MDVGGSDADDALDVATDACVRLLDDASQHLSERQLRVLSTIDFSPGLKTVVAGAGAGKTRTLSYIAISALMNGAVADVSLLASTKVAKAEALDRTAALYAKLGFSADVVPPLSARRVRTIHSVALRHARETADARGVAGAAVVGKAVVVELLRELLASALEGDDDGDGDGDDDGDAPPAPALSAVQQGTKDIVANMPPDDAVALLYNVRAERLKNCTPVVDRALGPTAHTVLRNLEVRMQEDRETGQAALDFDLMISDLAESGASLVGKDEVLIVDEAQDLSFCQVKIVLNTLRAGACVVVLGDDSQGIFQFSGALSNTIHELEAMARRHGISVSQHRLMKNHRSTDAVVMASEALLPDADREMRVDISGNGNPNVPVEAVLAYTAMPIATRIVDLVQSRALAPGEIVVMRHRNFAWTDELVKCVAAEAARHGVHLPVAILGQDAGQTFQMKTAAILQLALGLEHFVDSPDDGMQTVRIFLRGLRGTRGAPPAATKAVDAVWRRVRCDPAALFLNHADELVSEFKLVEAAVETSGAAAHPQAAKRPRTAASGESQKLKNFCETIRVAAASIRGVRERIRDLKTGNLPMRPIATTVGGQQTLGGAPKKFGVSRECMPTIRHGLGALAFVVARDLVDHKFCDDDAHALQLFVDAYDCEVDASDAQGEPFEEQLIVSTTRLVAELLDQDTKNKLVFSTIHKFKGRQRRCAILVDIKQPFCNLDLAKKASLSHAHDLGCTNLDGGGKCACDGFRIGMARMTTAAVAEKQRLYYVAASRAEERLFLAFAEDYDQIDALCPRVRTTAGQWAPVETGP